MCNLITEGTKHGCGHYQVTRKLDKIDCFNKRCRYSQLHPNPCRKCACEQFLGPDAKEIITVTTPAYCNECAYWFQQSPPQVRR